MLTSQKIIFQKKDITANWAAAQAIPTIKLHSKTILSRNAFNSSGACVTHEWILDTGARAANHIYDTSV